MTKKTTKPVQTEINYMPPMDECGRCAQSLFDVLAEIETLTVEKRNKMMALIQAMNTAKRASIKVKTKTFVLEHLEEDYVIKVKKS